MRVTVAIRVEETLIGISVEPMFGSYDYDRIAAWQLVFGDVKYLTYDQPDGQGAEWFRARWNEILRRIRKHCRIISKSYRSGVIRFRYSFNPLAQGNWRRGLKPGNYVYWKDPDAGACSRFLQIRAIRYEGDSAIITDTEGHDLGVMLKELR